jgi:hypothetical protein
VKLAKRKSNFLRSRQVIGCARPDFGYADDLSRHDRGTVVQGQIQDRFQLDRMRQALDLMTEALRLLDEARAPAQVGAHLDLAIVRLAEAIPPGASNGRSLEPPPLT